MPISDSEDYDQDHFNRVYEYIIKPACEKSGFNAVRADDVAQSNYIVIDILKKIVYSDLVLCDLSDRNPNVLYELGIRHAFNKPTVLLKDLKTPRIFDIQGLRYTVYNQTLRVDSVDQDVEKLSEAIKSTEESNKNDVNSTIQLMGITPAELPEKNEISVEASVVLSAINEVSSRLSHLERPHISSISNRTTNKSIGKNLILNLAGGGYLINGCIFNIGDTIYIVGDDVGKLSSVEVDHIVIERPNGKLFSVATDDTRLREIGTERF